jgi:hypothetical protein
MIRSPKRRFERQLHGTNSRKASIIDTAIIASQKTVFGDVFSVWFMHRCYKKDEFVSRQNLLDIVQWRRYGIGV